MRVSRRALAKYLCDMALFEFEVYWGTTDGSLLHNTIEVEAEDFAEAETIVFRDKPIPEKGYEACARREYHDGYFDAELVSDQED